MRPECKSKDRVWQLENKECRRVEEKEEDKLESGINGLMLLLYNTRRVQLAFYHGHSRFRTVKLKGSRGLSRAKSVFLLERWSVCISSDTESHAVYNSSLLNCYLPSLTLGTHANYHVRICGRDTGF